MTDPLLIEFHRAITESIIKGLRDMARTEYMDGKSGPDALRTAAKLFEDALGKVS